MAAEHPAEMIARVMMMANDDPHWDLSNKDRAAIQHVLDRMRTAEAALAAQHKSVARGGSQTGESK